MLWKRFETPSLLVLVALAGCGGKKEFPPRYPVAGVVTVDGNPAPRATVLFIPINAPEGQAYRGTSVAGEDGRFQLTTHFMNDGAGSGEYKVLITWPKYIKDGFGDTVPGPDQLSGKFNDEKNTTLTATVVTGNNTLDFNLKTK